MITSCPNPQCETDFSRSILVEETKSHLKLKCIQCLTIYSLENSKDQRNHLTNGKPVISEKVKLIDFLSQGDTISYKRRAWIFKYTHYAIVMSINKERGTVTVVEFARHLPLRRGYIVKEEKHFITQMAEEELKIIRFLPLDCLPVHEVLSRADNFIHKASSNPSLSFSQNCQHLASWCKTGEYNKILV